MFTWVNGLFLTFLSLFETSQLLNDLLSQLKFIIKKYQLNYFPRFDNKIEHQ